MKKIVGLDLGTNSIGWALINAYIDEYNKECSGINLSWDCLPWSINQCLNSVSYNWSCN